MLYMCAPEIAALLADYRKELWLVWKYEIPNEI